LGRLRKQEELNFALPKMAKPNREKGMADALKILGATYEWVDEVVPGMVLDLELETGVSPVRVMAMVSEVRPILFEKGLVYLKGTTLENVKLLRQYLPPKEHPFCPGELLESTTDNPKILGLVAHFLDAINYSNGAKFVEHGSLPPSLF
jgi:hypothetical protein